MPRGDQPIRIYVKKQLQIGSLSFDQRQMLKLGTVGVATVKNRAAAVLGPEDARAKPLTKRYARYKTKMMSRGGFVRTGPGSGRKGVRNLRFTGKMLENLKVRTVSRTSVTANLSTRKDRIKARANQNIETWLTFSPKNQKSIVESARRVFTENLKRIFFTKVLGHQY